MPLRQEGHQVHEAGSESQPGMALRQEGLEALETCSAVPVRQEGLEVLQQCSEGHQWLPGRKVLQEVPQALETAPARATRWRTGGPHQVLPSTAPELLSRPWEGLC